MAAAKFWDVPELKALVFSYLHDAECESDLTSCALVHSTWTGLANNALWQGHRGTGNSGQLKNDKIITALATLPRACRQKHASRVSVLDFSNADDSIIHEMFDGLDFARLKEVIFNDIWTNDLLTLSRYFLPKLETLRLVNYPSRDENNWFSASFLEDLAAKCPNLKQISFLVPEAPILSSDLARFFRSIRPREVRLELRWHEEDFITEDVLSALSYGGRLEVLVFEHKHYDFPDIEALVLQRFCESTANPFPTLKVLEIEMHADGVPWAVRCFPAVTILTSTFFISPEAHVKPVLKYLARLSQLQELTILGPEVESESNMFIPTKEFMGLGSLSKLTTLRISNSFLPDIDFTEADARIMFSGLGALENLTIKLRAQNDSQAYPKHILRAISRFCPRLDSIEFEGKLRLSCFLGPAAPRFENVTEMTVNILRTDLSPSEAPRIIDNAVPALVTLRCTSYHRSTDEICNAYTELQHPVRSNGLRPCFER
ncbi:hypothetical protein KCU92_g6508, partial [Aureobasidium melanogenum]|jgi:hypothetical protein